MRMIFGAIFIFDFIPLTRLQGGVFSEKCCIAAQIAA
jgi:hypothetical protein